MSTFKLTYLSCDGCEEEFDGAESTAGAIRLQAEAEGWKIARKGGDLDLCPQCQRGSMSSSGEGR